MMNSQSELSQQINRLMKKTRTFYFVRVFFFDLKGVQRALLDGSRDENKFGPYLASINR